MNRKQTDSRIKSVFQSYKETALSILLPERRIEAGSSLYANSIFLMVNSAAGAAMGFFFWVLAARLYPAEAVGLGSALLSAGGLLSFIAALGLGSGLIRFLPGTTSNKAALINSCFTLSGLVALAAALIFIAGIPFWSPALSFVRDEPSVGITFVTFVISGTLFTLLADTYLALRRAEYSLVQGALVGLLKLVLVAALASLFSIFGILASWTLATVTLVAAGLAIFLARLQPGYRPAPSLRREVSNEMVHFSFANYISLGLWSLPGWVLPLIVVKQLGSQANAYFFVGWSMATQLSALSSAISNSLFAEGSHQGTQLVRDIKKSLKLTALMVLPAAALLMAGGDKLLLVFGQQYSKEGAVLLWVLVPSILPFSLNVFYLAVARVQKKLKKVIAITAIIAIGTLGLSYFLLPRLGILGPGVAFLASQSLVALAGLPSFIRFLRAGDSRGKII